MQEHYVTLGRTHAARAVCASCSCVVTGAVMRRDVTARLHRPTVSTITSAGRVWQHIISQWSAACRTIESETHFSTYNKIKSHSVRTLKHTPTASVSSLPSLINHFQNPMKLIVTSTSSTKRPLEGVLVPQKCWRHGVWRMLTFLTQRCFCCYW